MDGADSHTDAPRQAANIRSAVEEFKQQWNVQRIIAFSGGADVEDEETQARISAVIADAMRVLCQARIGVLTGGTKWGVPRIAAEEAKRRDLPTIGIFPSGKTKELLPDEYLDLKIPIDPVFGDSDWGDES